MPTFLTAFRRTHTRVPNSVLASARFAWPSPPKVVARLAVPRIITAMAIVDETNGRIALLTIYDKQDADTVDLRIIKKMAQELGFAV